MMKKFSGLVAAVGMSFVLTACGGSGEEGESSGESSGSAENTETVTLQLGHALSPGTPAADKIDEMAETVAEETEGRVEFDIYPDSQLGSETEMLEQIQVGSMQAGAIMIGSMQTLDMKMAIEDLPYMWKDVEHAREAYKGEFGEQLADIISEQGLTQIGYLEWGPRHVTNNEKPIVEPEDLEGVNIRVAETALRVDAFEQVGALPTVMAFSEVYGALQQGALDAQENPLSVINAAKFYEVQDYLSLTGHFSGRGRLKVPEEMKSPGFNFSPWAARVPASHFTALAGWPRTSVDRPSLIAFPSWNSVPLISSIAL